MMPGDYEEAMTVHTVAEARAWMVARVHQFMEHWQHEGFGRDQARALICLNLAYIAGRQGEEAQRRVYRFYGAIHPLVLAMTKDERKGRQFLFEFADVELRHAADRWLCHSLSQTVGAPV